jgi:glycosyltransferase involved in cell wall biosynthesis
MDNRPLVTVIIPTYNRANLIGLAIESVFNQTYPNIQLIVIDDGSVDNTCEVVGSFENIEYIYKPNGGQGSARNYGFDCAKGKYIATLDSDDQWLPEFVEKQIENIEKYDLDFSFTNWHQSKKDGSTFDFLKSHVSTQPLLNDLDPNRWIFPDYSSLRSFFVNSCVSPSSGLIIRKDSFVSKWNEDINIADDWCILLDIITSKECKAAFTFQKLWLKGVNDTNIYDGRKFIEIRKLLYVEDFGKMIGFFEKSLNKNELNVFRKKYFKNLIKLSIYEVKRPGVKSRLQAFKYFGTALREIPALTDRSSFQVLMRVAKKMITMGDQKEVPIINEIRG